MCPSMVPKFWLSERVQDIPEASEFQRGERGGGFTVDLFQVRGSPGVNVKISLIGATDFYAVWCL